MLEKTRTTIRASPETIEQLQQLKKKLKLHNADKVIQYLIHVMETSSNV